MAAISNCLFEWEKNDYQLLMAAKCQELVDAGVQMPTHSSHEGHHCLARCGSSTSCAQLQYSPAPKVKGHVHQHQDSP